MNNAKLVTAPPSALVDTTIGNNDTWQAVGDDACIVHIEANGRVEHLDEHGSVTRCSDAGTARVAYLAWCETSGTSPDPALT